MLWSPSKNDFTYAEGGRFITLGPDVLGKKAEIEERWPELKCIFDGVDLEWSILETCADGKIRLALGQTFKRLDDRVIRRLARADDHGTAQIDLITAVDTHNALIDRENERKLEEIAGDAAERLHHAFRKDGLYDHDDIYGPNPRRGKRFEGAVRSSERDPS